MEQQVKRTHVLGYIQAKIDDIECQRDVPKLIVNIYGIVGIGKTQLMHQIFEYFLRTHTIVFLKFDISPEQPGYPEGTHSWSEVVQTLRAIPPLKQLPEQIHQADNVILPGDAVRLICHTAFTSSELETALTKPLVLLLDSLDDLPYWKWIQEQVIKPLLDQHHTLIVLTSQSPLFWHFWELREQSELLELDTFTLDETRHFLQMQGMEPLTETLYNLTGGYPLGLEYLLRLLRYEPTAELNEQFLTVYRHTMLEKLIERLPTKAQGAYLEDVLQHIGAMSTDFDLTSLRRQINEKRLAVQSEVLPPGRINSAITLLNSRGFVLYNREARKYRLVPLLKNLIRAPAESTSSEMA